MSSVLPAALVKMVVPFRGPAVIGLSRPVQVKLHRPAKYSTPCFCCGCGGVPRPRPRPAGSCWPAADPARARLKTIAKKVTHTLLTSCLIIEGTFEEGSCEERREMA